MDLTPNPLSPHCGVIRCAASTAASAVIAASVGDKPDLSRLASAAAAGSSSSRRTAIKRACYAFARSPRASSVAAALASVRGEPPRSRIAKATSASATTQCDPVEHTQRVAHGQRVPGGGRSGNPWLQATAWSRVFKPKIAKTGLIANCGNITSEDAARACLATSSSFSQFGKRLA